MDDLNILLPLLASISVVAELVVAWLRKAREKINQQRLQKAIDVLVT